MSLAGNKNPLDPRNSLIKYAIDAILDIKPKFALLENVVQQIKTPIQYNGEKMLIPDYIKKRLGQYYHINDNQIINAMDYGVPQNRQRAIFLFSRKDTNVKWKFPPKKDKIVTLREAIGDLPSLDSIIREKEYRNKLKQLDNKNVHPMHRPPTHAWRHVECMMHMPTGHSAWENEIYFPRKEDGECIE